ncbi:DUF2388 domain-containing protein [Pseudomonas chlororaphis]|uniref:DUF2388 domain-containing protein n=1 Tax=Pseudomonas chlororaphis TaxID=587753 RepID=UPI003B75D17D
MRDNKIVLAVRDDAGGFVVGEGVVRGVLLESARAHSPRNSWAHPSNRFAASTGGLTI